jgi:hypothetical protein
MTIAGTGPVYQTVFNRLALIKLTPTTTNSLAKHVRGKTSMNGTKITNVIAANIPVNMFAQRERPPML